MAKKVENLLPTVATHNFHDKCSLMRISCADNSIDAFDDTMQSRICADRHVGTAKIVVDRPDQPDDMQIFVLFTLLRSYIP